MPEEVWRQAAGETDTPTSITHLAVLRGEDLSVVSLPNGDIDAALEPASGVYHHDARHLSRLTPSFGGVAPIVLDTYTDGDSLSATLTNPTLVSPAGTTVPRGTLLMRRQRMAQRSLCESFLLSNYGNEPLRIPLTVAIAADFEDIFVVRGFLRVSQHPTVAADEDEDALTFASCGSDGQERFTFLHFSPRPSSADAGLVTWELDLEPRDTVSVEIVARVERAAAEERPLTYAVTAAQSEAAEHEWLDQMTIVETDDTALNERLRRCLLDVFSLQARMEGLPFTAAGVPWFDALFGRDSLITGIELLAFQPRLLRDALFVLARHQATACRPEVDAEPGKIPHEVRRGELAKSGELPFGTYYGSVDATPLFVVAAREYLRWSGDIEAIEALWPNIEAAMSWCADRQAESGHGFVTYARKSANGLVSQGWKDSGEAIVWPEGQPVEGPIALVEVQGYVAAAYDAYAGLIERRGLPGADRARETAARICRELRHAFADADLGFSLCLDGHGRPVPTPASNAGHLAWCGAVHRDEARRVAGRLLQPDLFGGWGVRTLSSRAGTYNPLGYHLGTVWPHDNAIILAGMRRYDLVDEVRTLGQAFVDFVLAFPDRRVPELFCGDARQLREVPTPYPVASRPQAWSAAAFPYVLMSMFGAGLAADGALQVTHPLLPSSVSWARVRNLRTPASRVDLTFRRHAGHVSVEVDAVSGTGGVVLGERWPERPIEDTHGQMA